MVVFLVNVPNIFAMPCGRVWAAALIPVALTFGTEVSRIRNDVSLVAIVVFGLIINAAASCGPSPLGGIGMMGEGMAGLTLNAFLQPATDCHHDDDAHSHVSHGLGDEESSYKDQPSPCCLRKVDAHSHSAGQDCLLRPFLILIGLTVIFIVQPPVPIQTLLIGMTVVVMIVGEVSLNDLF